MSHWTVHAIPCRCSPTPSRHASQCILAYYLIPTVIPRQTYRHILENVDVQLHNGNITQNVCIPLKILRMNVNCLHGKYFPPDRRRAPIVNTHMHIKEAHSSAASAIETIPVRQVRFCETNFQIANQVKQEYCAIDKRNLIKICTWSKYQE